MRSIMLVTFLMISGFLLQAQGPELPKKEFVFQAKTTSVDVNRGGSGKVDVLILKSKRYERSEVKLDVASSVPDGVTIKYDTATGQMNETVVVITTTDKVQPGIYNVILNCTMNYKTKGVMIKLKVI